MTVSCVLLLIDNLVEPFRRISETTATHNNISQPCNEFVTAGDCGTPHNESFAVLLAYPYVMLNNPLPQAPTFQAIHICVRLLLVYRCILLVPAYLCHE